MNTEDVSLLREMEKTIASFSAGTLDLGNLVEKLLVLRDSLTFKDLGWSHEFTQHVVTLDSASVEPPSGAREAKLVKAAVNEAVREIGRLIRCRLDKEQGG